MEMTSKRINMMHKQKKFFRTIFDTEIGAGGNLKDNQYIRLFQAKEDYSKVQFFNNIDNLIDYISSNKRYGINTYFNIGLTNGEGGAEQDMMTRTVIAFDFDKKDLGQDFNHVDLINRFKTIRGLWYHSLVDSGNGYHAYIMIEPTRDIDKVTEVTKALGDKLGADNQAMKSTQILRVPFTFNVKDVGRHKQVNIIKVYPLDTIKRFNINDLYSWHCMNEKDKQGTGEKITQFTLNTANIPYCIQRILSEGSPDLSRYNDLQNIVVVLRDRGKTLAEVKTICKEWSYKSQYNDNLDYRVEHLYNNKKYASLNCEGCQHYKECFTRVESNFNYPIDQPLLTMTESHARHLKASNRKGAKVMESNDILIYGILKNHSEGLYRAEVIEELTYRGKVCFSKDTITKALQSLEDNGFIEVEGKPKFYKLKEIRSNIELTYNISYSATYEAVKGNISTEELRLYNYMRYLHNKQQREDSKALKGNIFQFNQIDLAKDLGVTQGRISQMINNLLEEKILSIWHRQPSRNNGFDYYIYRLNY